jgi:hypothetical protein
MLFLRAGSWAAKRRIARYCSLAKLTLHHLLNCCNEVARHDLYGNMADSACKAENRAGVRKLKIIAIQESMMQAICPQVACCGIRATMWVTT